MKRSWPVAAFVAIALLAGAAAQAQPILYSFTGLPGTAADCQWFDDNLNADRNTATMDRQVNMLYNRVSLPVDANVAIGGSATTAAGGQELDYKLGSRTICSTAEAIYGPTPEPSTSPTPIATPT